MMLPKDDLQVIMETEYGRRFIMALLELCGVEQSIFGGGVDAVSFALGSKYIGEELQRSIRELDDGLHLELQMRLEARARPGAGKPEKTFIMAEGDELDDY